MIRVSRWVGLLDFSLEMATCAVRFSITLSQCSFLWIENKMGLPPKRSSSCWQSVVSKYGESSWRSKAHLGSVVVLKRPFLTSSARPKYCVSRAARCLEMVSARNDERQYSISLLSRLSSFVLMICLTMMRQG